MLFRSIAGRSMFAKSQSHVSHSNNDSNTIKERQMDPHSHAVILDPFFGKITFVPDLVGFFLFFIVKITTVRVDSLPHRKWKETKQQPDTAGPGNMFGCCLTSFHFL